MLEVWTQDGGQAGPEVSGGSRGQEHTATEKVKGQSLCEPFCWRLLPPAVLSAPVGGAVGLLSDLLRGTLRQRIEPTTFSSRRTWWRNPRKTEMDGWWMDRKQHSSGLKLPVPVQPVLQHRRRLLLHL